MKNTTIKVIFADSTAREIDYDVTAAAPGAPGNTNNQEMANAITILVGKQLQQGMPAKIMSIFSRNNREAPAKKNPFEPVRAPVSVNFYTPTQN